MMTTASPETALWTALPGRGVVRVSGPEGRDFLQGLVTADVMRVTAEQTAYGALLTPQGKILFDFFLAGDPAGDASAILLECDRACVDDLLKRLTFYRLRANVEIEDVSAATGVSVAWGAAAAPPPMPTAGGVMFADPRLAEMGFRLISPAAAESADSADSGAYHRHRLTLGVAEGSADMEPGRLFPAEVNLDLLNGVDYHKGCFIGQEVVSRMWRRGQARKRAFPVRLTGEVPSRGAAVDCAGRAVGTMCSGIGDRGLAVLRVESATDADLTVGATRLEAVRPAWMPAP